MCITSALYEYSILLWMLLFGTIWLLNASLWHFMFLVIRVGNLDFRANCSFFESESAIRSFQSVNPSYHSFCKEQQVQIALVTLFNVPRELMLSFTKSKRVMKCHSLCFGHKKGENMVIRTNWKRITLKKSESLFHKEQIAPITIYLKTTFSPLTLQKKSDWCD